MLESVLTATTLEKVQFYYSRLNIKFAYPSRCGTKKYGSAAYWVYPKKVEAWNTVFFANRARGFYKGAMLWGNNCVREDDTYSMPLAVSLQEFPEHFYSTTDLVAKFLYFKADIIQI